MNKENQLIITFDNQEYIAFYNNQSGYYEVQLKAPKIGGIYETNINFKDMFGNIYIDSLPVQVWAKETLKIDTNKMFMWIFDNKDLSVKDVIEIADYEIKIDEETNINSIVKVLKENNAKSDDIVFIKKNNVIVYWGIIGNIENEDGKISYKYVLKYITNLFDRNIILKNEELIKTQGIEDFIEKTITDEFINNEDTFINKKYLEVIVKTHTPKQVTVSNVNDGIYNFHTWITNCTQKYDIVYDFYILGKKIIMTIENKSYKKELIDMKAQNISNYKEVFETSIVSKVEVIFNKVAGVDKKGIYTLYLKKDRTTTLNKNDFDRADGRIETIFVENYEDAPQKALDVIKANSYNHNITFDLYEKYIKVGTPVTIKTLESLIFNTYISAITITPKKSYKYTCGNIRIELLDKLLKERKK